MKKYLAYIILTISLLALISAATADSVNFVVTGITGPLLDNILTKLSDQAAQEKPLTPKNIIHLYRNAPLLIQQAIEPFGYFSSKVYASGLHQPKRDDWEAHFEVVPGAPIRIKQINITFSGPGQDDPTLHKLQKNFPIKVGEIFSSDQYEAARDLLLQTANNRGYVKSVLTEKKVFIDKENFSAVITLHLETGSQYYFGEATFNQTSFDPNFLKRFISFFPGESFSSDKLLKMQEDLNNSHYFQQVTISPQMEKAKARHIPVEIHLTLPKAKRYTFGVGYGTFTGPRATFGVDYRRVGHSGRHFSVLARVSSELSGLSGKYFIPGPNPLTDQYILGAEIQKFSPNNGESYSENLSASAVKTIHDWQHTLSLNYLIERYEVVNNPTESSLLLYPSYTLSWIHADDLINPQNAKVLNFTIKGASDKILSHTTFIQGEIKGKYIFSPIENGRVILRADLGYTVVNDLLTLPLTLRYFAGGLGSVRGYSYSSIGPGRYLETASVELQHRIYGDLSAGIFYDVGTATNHFNDRLYRGEGVGLIYNSPIGPIQVYVARAMSLPGHPARVEFSIGPDL